MNCNEFFNKGFARLPVMAILRGLGHQRTLDACRTAWDSGIDLVEIPIQTRHDVDVLAAAASLASARGARVGAGTVTTLDRVRQAIDAGAAFTVAPGFMPGVAEASLTSGLPHLPGVATGTDIQNAHALGLLWLKAFPATDLGAGWIRSMHGPFPETRFVATGGVTLENAVTFLAAGAAGVSLGSALADVAQLAQLPTFLETLAERTAR